MSTKKLDAGEKHFLRLTARDADAEGWCKVSATLYPLVQKLPSELVEHEPVGEEGRARVRLTDKGQSILDAMEWL